MHTARVGFLSTLTGRDWQRVTGATPPQFVTDPSTFPIASPWSSSDMQRIVFEDIFGDQVPENTRSAAMQIPALARGANKVKMTIGGFPVVQLAEGEELPPREDTAARAAFRKTQPSWLYRTNGTQTPQHKLAWTVDDLIWYGWSCHSRVNDAKSRFPLSTTRVNQGDWSVNADAKVEIHGIVQKDEDVILIPGFHEGLLTFGHDAIRDARDLYAAVSDRIAYGGHLIDLHQVAGPTLNPEEREALTAGYRAARRKRGGSVGYSNKELELNVHPVADDGKLMIEARNAAAVDMARLLGIPAGVLDATAPKASLNYETQSGRNQEFTEDLWLYMSPIAARYSMDDLSPAGSHITFDLTNFTAPIPSPTGPALQD